MSEIILPTVSEAPAAPPAPARPLKKIVGYLVLAAALGVGGYYGINYLLYTLHHETTDNAQLSSDVYQLIPQVSGRIERSYVTDYQEVAAGDTLFTINSDDYNLRIASAQANLLNAEANLEVSRRAASTSTSGLDVSNANIAAAEAAYDKAQQDLARGENLVKDDVITKASFDAIQAQARAAEAQYQAARAQYSVTERQAGTTSGQIKAAEALVAQRQADLANARLTQSYTAILAPADGKLAETKIKAGQYVQAGQPLTTLIGKGLWVVANFKETQLGQVRVGQEASVEVDTYPGKEFAGRVVSLSPATGAKFSLLPPDNATGNFVKVVQRVPVKIELTDSIPAGYNLESGMNATGQSTHRIGHGRSRHPQVAGHGHGHPLLRTGAHRRFHRQRGPHRHDG